MTDDKDTAVKTKPLISKENAQNRPETIQRGQVLGVSAFREQIGNSTVKRRWPLCPVCRNTSRKNGRSFLMSVAGRNITSFAGNAKGAASSVSYYQRQYFNASSAVERLQERYDRLKEKCQPFLQALEHFPKLVEVFVKKVKELFSIKEAQERKEREDRAAARKEQSKHRRGRNDWERQCRQAGHPRVASEPRALREGYHAHGGRGQKSLRSTQGNL